MWRFLDVTSAADLDTCVQEGCRVVGEASSSFHSTSTQHQVYTASIQHQSNITVLRQMLKDSSWFRQQYAPHYQALAALYSLQ